MRGIGIRWNVSDVGEAKGVYRWSNVVREGGGYGLRSGARG